MTTIASSAAPTSHTARFAERVAMSMAVRAITAQKIESEVCTSVDCSMAFSVNGTPNK